MKRQGEKVDEDEEYKQEDDADSDLKGIIHIYMGIQFYRTG